ncbi:MAG: hypothetical protein ACRDFQ_07680 [Anaerolineales bacterium]
MKQILAFFTITAFLAACAPAPAATDVSDLEHAQQTLIDFFSLLANGEYEAAAERHSEHSEFYEDARRNNPDVDPNDHAALLEAACTFQLRCLEIREVLGADQVGENQYDFVVNFSNPDGSLFVLGPCCGEDETSMPPVSEFVYRVEKVGSEFFVLGSSVYVP